jgi:hypothetical protein
MIRKRLYLVRWGEGGGPGVVCCARAHGRMQRNRTNTQDMQAFVYTLWCPRAPGVCVCLELVCTFY